VEDFAEQGIDKTLLGFFFDAQRTGLRQVAAELAEVHTARRIFRFHLALQPRFTLHALQEKLARALQALLDILELNAQTLSQALPFEPSAITVLDRLAEVLGQTLEAQVQTAELVSECVVPLPLKVLAVRLDDLE
jgi:hypothetical protein